MIRPASAGKSSQLHQVPHGMVPKRCPRVVEHPAGLVVVGLGLGRSCSRLKGHCPRRQCRSRRCRPHLAHARRACPRPHRRRAHRGPHRVHQRCERALDECLGGLCSVCLVTCSAVSSRRCGTAPPSPIHTRHYPKALRHAAALGNVALLVSLLAPFRVQKVAGGQLRLVVESESCSRHHP